MSLPPADLDAATRDFYVRVLNRMNESGVPFLVGGAYSLAEHAGIVRHTKDLDLFVRPADRDRTLSVLAAMGYRTDTTFPHWLAKAFHGEHFVDVIYSSGNGLSTVDDDWFAHAIAADVFGVPVRICPAEEVIWTKAFIQERERFDGADVAHLLRHRAETLDWDRLLLRFGEHHRVLLAHLLLFGFIYPNERHKVPDRVLRTLIERAQSEPGATPGGEKVCKGTFLSREQYLVDIEQWGYRDARVGPEGTMAERDVAHWTAAIDHKEK